MSEQIWEDMTPSDVLRAAADELMVHGWHRHDWGESDGCKCAVGAIRYVCGSRTDDHEMFNNDGSESLPEQAIRLLAHSLNLVLLGDIVDQVVSWNDDHDKDHVIRGLLTVADELEAADAAP